MNTIKNINANGTMSNLVGLYAIIKDDVGKVAYVVFIYGKADDDHFLVQLVRRSDFTHITIRIIHLREMMSWIFYPNADSVDTDVLYCFDNNKLKWDFDPRDTK